MEQSIKTPALNSPLDTAPVLRTYWREIVGVFLKLGAMSYGGPALA